MHSVNFVYQQSLLLNPVGNTPSSNSLHYCISNSNFSSRKFFSSSFREFSVAQYRKGEAVRMRSALDHFKPAVGLLLLFGFSVLSSGRILQYLWSGVEMSGYSVLATHLHDPAMFTEGIEKVIIILPDHYLAMIMLGKGF